MDNKDTYLKNIERDLNSIDRTLGRIADSLEKMIPIEKQVGPIDITVPTEVKNESEYPGELCKNRLL